MRRHRGGSRLPCHRLPALGYGELLSLEANDVFHHCFPPPLELCFSIRNNTNGNKWLRRPCTISVRIANNSGAVTLKSYHNAEVNHGNWTAVSARHALRKRQPVSAV